MRNGPAVEGRGRNWDKTKTEHAPYTNSTFPGQRFCRTVSVGEAATHALQRLSEQRRRACRI
jgi:hypothetical protein